MWNLAGPSGPFGSGRPAESGTDVGNGPAERSAGLFLSIKTPIFRGINHFMGRFCNE